MILPDRPPILLHTSRVPALSPVVSLLVSIRRCSALTTLKIPSPQACEPMFSPMPTSVTLSVNDRNGRTNLESLKQTP